MNLSDDLRRMIKGMTYSTALEFLKQGYPVRRAQWRSDYYIKLQGKTIVAYDLEIRLKGHWDAEDRHMLAEDWEFYLGEEFECIN